MVRLGTAGAGAAWPVSCLSRSIADETSRRHNGKGQMTVNYSITGHRLGEGCAALKPHARVNVAS
jgi:hypothetical protein